MRRPNGIDLGLRRAVLPRDVPDVPLVLWLPAEGIVNSGGVVTSPWRDISGRDNHATPSGSPTYVANAINGFPGAAVAAASSQKFTLPDAFSVLTSAEVFIVCKTDGTTTISLHGLGNGDFEQLYPFSDGHIYDDFGSTTRLDCGAAITSLAAYHVFNARSAQGARSVHLNGALQFTSGANVVGFRTTPELGHTTFGPGRFFSGTFVEAFMFGGVLSANWRTLLLTRYLRWKFGLT